MLGKPKRCRSLGYQYKQAKVMCQGNGGHKKTRTYNEDPELSKYVEHLVQLSFILKLKLETGVIMVDHNELNGDLSFYFKE